MKCRKWILCLLMVTACGVTQADLSPLEKLRSTHPNQWYEVGDVGYDIALMGDDAIPFLIQTLTDEDLSARLSAINFLADYYPDARVLPALTKVFLSESDLYLRIIAARAIARHDPESGRPLLIKCLAFEKEPMSRLIAVNALEELGDKRARAMFISQLVSELEHPKTRRAAAYQLAEFKDKRAVPALLKMLDDDKLNAYGKGKTAFALANFKDKRAVPVLLEMLNDKELQTHVKKNEVEGLVQIGDERVIPILIDMLNDPDLDIDYKKSVLAALAQTGDERVIPALLDAIDPWNMMWDVNDIKAFGPSIVPPLLEQMNQTESHQIRAQIVRILEDIHYPEVAPIYEQVYLETEDGHLQRAMLRAFVDMGTVGFESLLKVAKRKPNHNVWSRLSTYNGAVVVNAVAGLALDESYPFRSEAIEGLGRFGELWKAEIAEHIPRLLTDTDPVVILNTLYLIQELKMTESWEAEIAEHVPRLLAEADPEVKFRTIRLIKLLNMTEMIPALQKLTQTSDTQIRNAAHNVLAVLSETTPLTLSVKMHRSHYDYGQPVDLTYRITNVSPHPITISTFVMDLRSKRVKLEIHSPDGTFLGYGGPAPYFARPRRKNYQILKSGDELTATVSYPYWLHQPGRYTVRIHYDPFDDGVQFGFLGWTRRLTSSQVHFDIKPPTAKQFNRMLARIDTKPIRKTYDLTIETCYQLGELRIPEAIPALKKLALTDPNFRLCEHVLAALAKFSNHPELTPTWSEILKTRHSGNVHEIAMKALGASGDPRAIEPLRRASYRGHYTIEAVLALQQLGDDSSIERLRNKAWQKLQHKDKTEREEGVQMLRQLQPRRDERRPRRNQPPDPQEVLTNTWLFAIIDDRQLGIKWVAAGAKAVTLAAVEGLLEHPNPKIQRSAAYALARLGNASGAHLIQSDLYANDVSTRWTARVTLLGIRPQ